MRRVNLGKNSGRRRSYKNRGHDLAGFLCVSITYEDRCLSGALGEVWYKGKGLYHAFEVTKSKDEKLSTFEEKDLKKVLRRLKVPMNPDDQVYWANNPNARLK